MLFTNIVNSEARPQLTRRAVVWARDIVTPKLLEAVVMLAGSDVPVCNSAESVNFVFLFILQINKSYSWELL